MTAQAYPLQWPQGRPRLASFKRKDGRFHKTDWRTNAKRSLTVSEAVARLMAEANRIGARGVVISSNLEIRQDGLPRSGQRKPDDPGVCVYFHLAGKSRAMPCDTYRNVEDNIAAIAAHIEATRAIERHGVATVSEMFAGFTALPPQPGVRTKRPWWEVMNLDPKRNGRAAIEARFRELAKTRHPDAGGSDEAMAELNQARKEALGL
jgi:hypothetical protein